MENVGIFLFGIAVTTLVALAASLIVWGFITERRDRMQLEAEQASRGVGPKARTPRSETTEAGTTRTAPNSGA